MPHGLDLAQRARILELADRRVIVRHLVDAATANLVQPGIAHVREAAPARVDDGQGRRHRPCRSASRRALAASKMASLARVTASRSRLPVRPACRECPVNRLGGNLGGALAGVVAADAVDDAIHPAPIVEEEAIFVVRALQPGMRVAGCATSFRHGRSSRVSHATSPVNSAMPATRARCSHRGLS